MYRVKPVQPDGSGAFPWLMALSPTERETYVVDSKKYERCPWLEVIEAIEDWGLNYHRGNCVKYLARAGKKDPAKELEDLRKASWYLDREIERLKAVKEGREPVRPNNMNPKTVPAKDFIDAALSPDRTARLEPDADTLYTPCVRCHHAGNGHRVQRNAMGWYLTGCEVIGCRCLQYGATDGSAPCRCKHTLAQHPRGLSCRDSVLPLRRFRVATPKTPLTTLGPAWGICPHGARETTSGRRARAPS